jgi:hypothetical protein
MVADYRPSMASMPPDTGEPSRPSNVGRSVAGSRGSTARPSPTAAAIPRGRFASGPRIHPGIRGPVASLPPRGTSRRRPCRRPRSQKRYQPTRNGFPQQYQTDETATHAGNPANVSDEQAGQPILAVRLAAAHGSGLRTRKQKPGHAQREARQKKDSLSLDAFLSLTLTSAAGSLQRSKES